LLQQGGLDDAVPKAWSDSLYNRLDKMDKDIDYKVYPGSDHNMRPAWDEAVSDDLNFFNLHFSK
jgi:dipeptidyl aminopeptidase/acylaminoacyl peptidase